MSGGDMLRLPLFLLGAGGHGRSVADCAAEANRWDRIAFLDDAWPSMRAVLDWEVAGRPDDLEAMDPAEVFVAIGDNAVRRRLHMWASKLDHSMPVVRHPHACVSSRAQIGEGTVVMPGAMVNVASTVGKGAILNTSSSVDHDCELGDFVHISPGAHLAGGVNVGDGAWVGIGAAVREGISIGTNAIIAAGAVVVRDVPAGMRVSGVPAKAMPVGGGR